MKHWIRSPRELAVRGRQALDIAVERLGHSPAIRRARSRRWTERGAVLELDRFRAVRPSRFFAAFDDLDATAAAGQARWPDAADAAVRSAEAVLEGRFHLLGYPDLSFGDPVDWWLDATTGRRSPDRHWSRIPLLDAESTGDLKVTWELNRHQFLLELGRAFAYSRDERFARGFVELLDAWLDANPPKRGVNWASSLELAFRAVSWTWALHFFRHAEALTPDFFHRLMASLYLHGRHIEAHLSTYHSPNTHLTGEALALYHLGTVFPELHRADRWRRQGRAILIRELLRQVRPDGTYFEQSLHYHRYTADFYLAFLVLADRAGDTIPPTAMARVHALLRAFMHLLRPDGGMPRVGDDDGGRLLALSETDPGDGRPTLALAAAVLQDPELRMTTLDAAEEVLWLLGRDGLERFEDMPLRSPASGSVAFREGGFHVMRDGWHSDADFLLVDAGPHGGPAGGHAHADALALEVAVAGRPVLVDSGTFTYAASPESRNRYRHTAAHNALLVDGTPSSEPAASPFAWVSAAATTVRTWHTNNRFDLFEGEHDGFQRLPDPVRYTRGILFLKGDYWVLRDRIDAAGRHALDARFHFAPGIRVVADPDSPVGYLAATDDGETALRLFAAGASARPPEPSPVSEVFGREAEGTLARLVAETRGRHEIATVLLPGRFARRLEATPRVHEASGGRVLELIHGQVDRIILGEPGRATEWAGSPTIRTDAAWAWIRCSPASDEPVELMFAAGSELRLDGRILARTEAPVAFLFARLTDGRMRFRVEPETAVLAEPVTPAMFGSLEEV